MELKEIFKHIKSTFLKLQVFKIIFSQDGSPYKATVDVVTNSLNQITKSTRAMGFKNDLELI